MVAKLIRIILILFLLPTFANAASSVKIINWQENSLLTTDGKNSEITIQGKVVNLVANQIIKSFIFGINKERDIQITQVMCDGKPVNYTFVGNSLNIQFVRPKKNGELISLYFAYEEKYQKINKFLRQEVINIPSFAAGANARVVINFPGSLESATLNPNITKSGNSFIYSNIVPAKGVQEIIKLTSAQDSWNAVVRVKISSDQPLENTVVKMPVYFQNGGQRVDSFGTQSSIQPLKKSGEIGKNIFEFDTTAKEITIENRARISTGIDVRTRINRDPNKYKNFTEEEAGLLTSILNNIKQDPQYNNLPLYAKIGKFVHEYIKYDPRYTDRLFKINEILQNKVGVCTEYARLYDGLARVAGIPSIIINGAACGEYSKCAGHAWNLIYIDNQWINVDPTWDLMSGIVSSSHIYFNDNDSGDAEVGYIGKKKTVYSKIDLEIKNIN